MVSTERDAQSIFLKNQAQSYVPTAEPKEAITKKIALSIYNVENHVQNAEI